MPARYRIDSARRLVVQNIFGVVQLNEMLAMLASLRQDPDFDPDFDVLADLSAMSATEITFQATSQAVSSGVLNPFSNISRCAVVAPGDLAFGMARMYEAIRKGGEFEIFRSMADAEAWLAEGQAAEAS